MLKGKSLQVVQAMDKTLEMLDFLANCRDKLTIAEIAEKLSLKRREVMFLLVTLEARQLVRWDEAARLYRPGQAALDLSKIFTTRHAPAPSSKKKAATPLVCINAGSRSGRRMA